MEMPQINPETRLQELGKEFTKARRLFRRLGVEVDSRSDSSVAEVCELAGISIKDFARTLVAMTPGRSTAPTIEEWTQAPLQALIGHIQERHHTYTRQELIRLGRLLDEAVSNHSGHLPELFQIQSHFQHLREDLLQHLEAEERVIFPAILKSTVEAISPLFTTLEDLQGMALKEHEAAEELFQNIGMLTRNFTVPQDAAPVIRSLYLGLRDLEEDLFMHIYLENHILFPRAAHVPGKA